MRKSRVREQLLLIPPEDWRCPACNGNCNSQGELLYGCRSVALHLAGKIKTGDRTHSKWAERNVGSHIYDREVYSTINTLGRELESSILEHNRARVAEEQKKIQSAIDERDAREPRVLAFKFAEAIERSLHACVCESLKELYGEDGEEWWVKGVPTNIRAECAKRREESPERDDVYNYTDILHLKTIVEKNRNLFEPRLMAVGRRTDEQKEFLDSIARFNEIRNKVMHTIRSQIEAEDMAFLRQFTALVDVFVR